MSQLPYTVGLVQKKDVDVVMKLLKKTFFIDEPLNEAVGLCSGGTETCPELEEYCKHSLLEGLSYKAVDGEDNIVGIIISEVSPLKEEDNGHDLLSRAQRCQNPKFQKILYILAQREAATKLWQKFPEDQNLVDVKVAATHPEWRRRGIMNELLAETDGQRLSERCCCNGGIGGVYDLV